MDVASRCAAPRDETRMDFVANAWKVFMKR
jgi:hypothetical protein